MAHNRLTVPTTDRGGTVQIVAESSSLMVLGSDLTVHGDRFEIIRHGDPTYADSPFATIRLYDGPGGFTTQFHVKHHLGRRIATFLEQHGKDVSERDA